MTAQLYPAIDLRAGRVVRLLQGDYDQETTYGDDPVAVAVSFAEQGATWIHVVDLDAARSGSPRNRHVVAAIADAVQGRARVQTGGGVRTVADAEVLADAGVARVVMGSAAVRDQGWWRRRRDESPSPSASIIATASSRCTAGPRAAACSCSTHSPGSRVPRRS
ncbi:MAG: HisA/HisF-related TIM barrel protein [Ilumatobacteraceae bacterium]